MEISNFKKVRNFIEFTKRPFTVLIVSGETGLSVDESKKVMGRMKTMGLVKRIGMEGKFSIYVRNIDYKEVVTENPFGYNIKLLKAIIKVIRDNEVKHLRQLANIMKLGRRQLARYLIALCSIGMIGYENGFFVILKEVEIVLIGSKYDKDIIPKLKGIKIHKEKGVNMAKEKVLYDAQGREYSAKLLDPQIVKKEDLISKVMDKAMKLHDHILNQKQKIVTEVEDYLSKVADQYGESWKGNAELVSFDSKFKVEIRYRERIQFDEKLQIAKQKIDDCLKRWSENSNLNLQAVIKEAFQVDKKGEIAKSRILGLRKYNIKDPEWIMAMDLIDQAIQITSTKQYIAFYYRPEPDKPYQQVLLNFSAM